MASNTILGSPFTIASADTFQFGSGAPDTSSARLIMGTATAFVGTGLVLKARKRGSTQAYLPIPYVRYNIAAAASDGTIVSAALSGSFIIVAPDSGLELQFDNTAGYTSGSFVVEYLALAGGWR